MQFYRGCVLGTKILGIRFHRILGRCRSCRKLISFYRGFAERVHNVRGAARDVVRPTIFDGVSVDAGSHALREVGYYAGYQLPPTDIDEILRFARETICSPAQNASERFFISEVRNGRSPMGQPIVVADVDMSQSCSAIEAVSNDPMLVETARNYLGYTPRRVIKRLYWSPVSGLPDEVRRANGQTIDFHYDIDPSSSLYVYFYITGANASSGAHVVLPKSHGRKPFSIVVSSCFQSEHRIARFYPHLKPAIIEGGPGYGFAENPACFHKALPPTVMDRLILQLRYS